MTKLETPLLTSPRWQRAHYTLRCLRPLLRSLPWLPWLIVFMVAIVWRTRQKGIVQWAIPILFCTYPSTHTALV